MGGAGFARGTVGKGDGVQVACHFLPTHSVTRWSSTGDSLHHEAPPSATGSQSCPRTSNFSSPPLTLTHWVNRVALWLFLPLSAAPTPSFIYVEIMSNSDVTVQSFTCAKFWCTIVSLLHSCILFLHLKTFIDHIFSIIIIIYTVVIYHSKLFFFLHILLLIYYQHCRIMPIYISILVSFIYAFYSRIGATVQNNFPPGINKVLLILDFFFSLYYPAACSLVLSLFHHNRELSTYRVEKVFFIHFCYSHYYSKL